MLCNFSPLYYKTFWCEQAHPVSAGFQQLPKKLLILLNDQFCIFLFHLIISWVQRSVGRKEALKLKQGFYSPEKLRADTPTLTWQDFIDELEHDAILILNMFVFVCF